MSAGQARLVARELEVARARQDAERAAALVVQLQPSATAAADAVAPQRTPVARPPAPGRTRRDAAAQARQALDDAVLGRAQAGRALADIEAQLEPVRRENMGASSELAARLAELAQARDALDGLRRLLVAAEQATPALAAAGSIMLVPRPSPLAASSIPPAWMDLYGRGAATCPGLPWTVLAAVGAVESAHGQSTAPGVRDGANFAGAMGPMQFLAGTWAGYAVDGDADGVRNVYDPDDAVFGAARYLCANGGGQVTSLRNALWHYNHADWYVEMVLELAARY